MARLARARARLARGIRLRLRPVWPPVGTVRALGIGRVDPVSRDYGFDRGTPVDRHYIQDFLRRHAASPDYASGDIRGRVLEVGGDEYATRFGGRAGTIDVLHVDASNPVATIVGDLTRPDELPREQFDCVICTQTLHVIWDFRSALAGLHQVLRPDGVLLITVPGITSACKPDRDLWGDYWRFTTLSFRRLLEERFDAADVRVEAYGNVSASVAFLHGIAAEEMPAGTLALRDPDYEMLICARARRRA